MTMSSARAVTATFTSGGGGGGKPTLTVSPAGNGKVTGSGINCGAGNTDCSESYSPGTAGHAHRDAQHAARRSPAGTARAAAPRPPAP